MLTDLNQKVHYNETPYDVHDTFAIYSISEQGLKDYTSQNHFSHHHLNKFPKEIMEQLNQETNGYKYDIALQRNEEIQKECENNKSNNNSNNSNENKQVQKKVEFKKEVHNEKLFNNKKPVVDGKKGKKVGNSNNVLDNDVFHKNKEKSKTFNNYNSNIERSAGFNSSVQVRQMEKMLGLTKGKNNTNTNSDNIIVRNYPKIKTSK